jgi:hypothetical protein
MDNVIVNASVAFVASAPHSARRSRFDDLLARHRQRRLESLAFWAGVLVVASSLLMV